MKEWRQHTNGTKVGGLTDARFEPTQPNTSWNAWPVALVRYSTAMSRHGVPLACRFCKSPT
jgi:hypothetical protein